MDAADLCKSKLQELNALRPIGPQQEARILQKLRLEWDFHSNHLEGNSLTYGETRALILHGITAQGKPLRDHFEILGHDEAVHFVEDLVSKQMPLSEAVIRQVHQLVLKEDHEIHGTNAQGLPTVLAVKVGQYKNTENHVVTITGERLFFSSPADTPIHMAELIEWYRAHRDDEPLGVAAFVHHRLTRIHPFTDGNGRVARLVSNFLLMMGGFPPLIIKTQEKSAYFAALQQADAGEMPAFEEFLGQRLLASLDLMIRGARGEDVDELGDVDKRFKLLQKRFEANEQRVSVLKDPVVVQQAWDRWILPSIKALEARSQQYASFYVARRSQVNIGNSVLSADDLDTQVKALVSGIESPNEIGLQVVFNGLRMRGGVDERFILGMNFNLLSTHIAVSNGAAAPVAQIAWDQTPERDVWMRWIEDEESRHLNFLEQHFTPGDPEGDSNAD